VCCRLWRLRQDGGIVTGGELRALPRCLGFFSSNGSFPFDRVSRRTVWASLGYTEGTHRNQPLVRGALAERCRCWREGREGASGRLLPVAH
jgi:hypothetical protein